MEKPKYQLEKPFDPSTAHPDDAHSQIVNLVPPNARVLEIGCASGYLSGYLTRRKGCTVTGVEIDPRAVEIAANYCQRVINGDIEDPATLNQVEGEFDVLLLAAVLEHLKHPERVLTRLRNHLAPGGLAIVSLPNVAHWRIRLQLLRGRFDYQDYGVMDRTHLHFYTVKSGRELIEASGYTVIDLRVAGSLVQHAANRLARAMGREKAPNILPGLLGYEIIYRARLQNCEMTGGLRARSRR